MTTSPPVGELYSVANQIDENLAQPGHVTDQNLRNRIIHQAGEVQVLFRRLGSQQIHRLLDAGVEFEGMVLQLDFARFYFGEIENVVDDCQECFGAATGGLYDNRAARPSVRCPGAGRSCR